MLVVLEQKTAPMALGEREQLAEDGATVVEFRDMKSERGQQETNNRLTYFRDHVVNMLASGGGSLAEDLTEEEKKAADRRVVVIYLLSILLANDQGISDALSLAPTTGAA